MNPTKRNAIATRANNVVTGGNSVPRANNVNQQAPAKRVAIATRAIMPPKQLGSQYAGLPIKTSSA